MPKYVSSAVSAFLICNFSGNFGACLMANPELVASCVEAMATATNLPITVKHRIGIDNLDSDELLINFVDLINCIINCYQTHTSIREF